MWSMFTYLCYQLEPPLQAGGEYLGFKTGHPFILLSKRNRAASSYGVSKDKERTFSCITSRTFISKLYHIQSFFDKDSHHTNYIDLTNLRRFNLGNIMYISFFHKKLQNKPFYAILPAHRKLTKILLEKRRPH